MRNPVDVDRPRSIPGGAVLCPLLLLTCVLIAHPWVEMGVNDDWSYVWSAKVLAETGRMTYNGWGAHLLGWQMWLGAAAIKLFGFSFTHVRFTVLAVALATVSLLQRILVRMGLNEWNATLVTLMVAGSPVFFPLAFSFMSEVPGTFCMLVCLYGCIRAVQAATDSSAVGWVVFAGATNVLLGSARQIDWLGLLVMVPATAFYLRRRRGVLAAGAVTWIAGAASMAVWLHWLSVQPYAVIEPPWGRANDLKLLPHIAMASTREALKWGIFCFPVLAGFLWLYPSWGVKAKRQGLIFLGLLTLVTTGLLVRRIDAGIAFNRGTASGDYLGRSGLLQIPGVLGQQPDLFSPAMRVLITAVALGGMAGLALVLWHRREMVQHEDALSTGAVPARAVFYLLGPYAAAYGLLIATRITVFDRYVLPLIIVAMIPVVRLYQQRLGGRLPWVTVAAVALYGAFTTAGMHDKGVEYRARLAAVGELREANVPREQIKASFEYDGWTELMLAGYVNNPHIERPAGAYQPVPASVQRELPPECTSDMGPWTPRIRVQYFLTNEPLECFTATPFPVVRFSTWLPPHAHEVRVEQRR